MNAIEKRKPKENDIDCPDHCFSIRLRNLENQFYRVSQLLLHLGWFDFDFGCFNACLILLGQMGIWQNWLGS